ncbi:hypothetical protein [Anaerotruncus rubiinfantis]|uniref:hypothetical protein n=1 Tax=Anaerotruncus rubiinfantis TaxID=1720200 RepID=UPI00189BE518|nr:hypothetical protein [Anaerotruncus rubiinfantis]
MPEKKKLGRPTDSPKIHTIRVRLDERSYQILSTYCERNHKSIAEGVRDGIERLEEKP